MSDKRKLSVEEQIEDLKSKNVKFELCTEEEAKIFLTYNNYYFKLKSYAHNYDRYRKKDWENKYVNLDFKYIMELSTLDMHFRRLIVRMCLDIEHILKTRLMNDITKNSEEDGYNIVRKYINEDYMVMSNLYGDKEKSATSELIKKFENNEDNIPVWSFIETLSFGKFIEIYNFYYGMYCGKSYSSYLGNIKFLRNAAAHNTCLLNSLKKPYSIKINKNKNIMDKLAKTKKFSTSYKTKMENPVIHNFIVLLFVYYDILDTKANQSMREAGIKEIEELFFSIMLRNENKDYFEKNDAIRESYNFVCDVIKYLRNCKQKLL